MKTALILLVILCSSMYAIDERKVDVYFANGIETSRGLARANAKILEDSISGSLPLFYDEYLGNIGKKGKVAVAYNQTVDFGPDIWESIVQKIDILNLVDLMFTTRREADVEKQVTAYKNSIESGHRVLVVAHSQGNLFTGDAYNALEGWMKDYFFAVSVASPRHFKIKSNTPHIAFSKDIVPYFGGVFVSVDNPNGEVGSIESHAFSYYMGYPSAVSNVSTNVAKIKITRGISDGYRILNDVSSQWILTDKDTYCTGDTCKQKRRHAIHITNTKEMNNILDQELIYPFKDDGKVYRVDGGYVKKTGQVMKVYFFLYNKIELE